MRKNNENERWERKREKASQIQSLMENVSSTGDVGEYPAKASEGEGNTDHSIQQGAYGRIM